MHWWVPSSRITRHQLIFESVIVGPLIGGFLSNPADKFPSHFNTPFFVTYPYFLPCAISSLISFLGFIFGYFHLEETLHTSHLQIKIVHTGENGKFNEVTPIEKTGLPPQSYPAILGLGLLALTAIINQETFPLLAATPVDVPQNGLGFDTNDLGISLCFQGAVTLLCQVISFCHHNALKF